jgi:GT2 family glycosyltransferase
MRWLGRRGGGPGPGPGGGAQPPVSVAIPVRNGGPLLERTLVALASQTVEHELLVCDSGSRDGSLDLARAHGARVIEIAPQDFGHGATRNLLMAQARGVHVALLTQDAEPAGPRWLEALLGGFEEGGDVAVAYGPYLPRADASRAVALELEWWFSALAPNGEPSVERLDERERTLPAGELVRQRDWEWVGRRGFLSDANACVARAAWERVPFRAVPYAEDRVLALDLLRAGYAKAFVPAAAVVHSHDHPPLRLVQRSFDEWRGLREVYGWREPASPRHAAGELRGALGRARRELLAQGAPASERRATLPALSAHHVLRLTGALLGSRADLLAPGVRRRLSLEGRAGFAPVDLDAPIDSPDR